VPLRPLAPRRSGGHPRRRLPREQPGRVGGPVVAPLPGGGRRSGRSFAFRTLPERLDVSRRDSTTWRYDLEPVDGGTRVRHSYEITSLPVQPIRAFYGLLMPHHRDMRPHMRANLEALREMFAGDPIRPRRDPPSRGDADGVADPVSPQGRRR
jgi:hypothetical protein